MISAIATLMIATVVLPRADVPPPGAVRAGIVTINGSGCPPGTAAVAVSPDNSNLHAIYSNYLAAVGAGARPTDFRKNCQLAVKVDVPQGFTFGVTQVDYRGFVHLEPGATGTLRRYYYFQGMPAPPYRSHTWQGPQDDDWYVTDTVDVGMPVYRPCGETGNLHINTELRVSAGTSDPATSSYLAMDSTDVYTATVYRFAWKRCP
jgi:hypothetical protein